MKYEEIKTIYTLLTSEEVSRRACLIAPPPQNGLAPDFYSVLGLETKELPDLVFTRTCVTSACVPRTCVTSACVTSACVTRACVYPDLCLTRTCVYPGLKTRTCVSRPYFTRTTVGASLKAVPLSLILHDSCQFYARRAGP